MSIQQWQKSLVFVAWLCVVPVGLEAWQGTPPAPRPRTVQEKAPQSSAATAAAAATPAARTKRGIDPLQRLYRHNRRGNAAFDQGEVERALEAYVEAQALAPRDPRVLYNLGNALAKQGKAEDALTTLERAAIGAKDAALQRDAAYNSGVVQLGEEDLQGALRSFGRALTVDPNDAEARRNLELALRKLQQQQQEQQQNDQNQDQQEQDQENQDQQNQDQNQDQKQDQKQNEDQQQQNQQQNQDDKKQQQKQREQQAKQDPQRAAARRLLKALENAEKDALRKALIQKMEDLRDRKEDW